MSSRLDGILQRQFVTSDDVRSAALRSESQLIVPENCTVTDEARELALKLSIRFDDAGARLRAPAVGSPAQRTVNASAADADKQTWPEDTNRRVVKATSEVLKQLGLGEREAVLLPTIVRRVFAGLASNRS